MAYDIEGLLHAALNNKPLPKPRGATIRKNFSAPSYFRHEVTVRYSVQEAWGGPRFVVTYKENSIKHDEVKENAMKDMNQKGYTNIIFLDLEST